jgi:aldose 1-epimerase
MTVANLASASQSSQTAQTRRARLAAAAHPVLAGPSTSAVAVGETSGGDVACVTLANTHLRLDVAPSLGGGITRFDWRSDGALVPIFRRCRHVAADTDPNQLACYPMLPYSNRIGGGHFGVGGRRIDVPRNRVAEPLPIHGDGWLAHWGVAETGPDRVRLTLDRSDGKPFAYRATQTYALEGPTLVITLRGSGCRATTGCRCATCRRRRPGSSAWLIRCRRPSSIMLLRAGAGRLRSYGRSGACR